MQIVATNEEMNAVAQQEVTVHVLDRCGITIIPMVKYTVHSFHWSTVVVVRLLGVKLTMHLVI